VSVSRRLKIVYRSCSGHLTKTFRRVFQRRSEEKERRVKKERRAKDVVMGILLDVVMEKNLLEEKTSLSTQVGVPGPVTWASPPQTGGVERESQLLV
jgi:hypothetical protein